MTATRPMDGPPLTRRQFFSRTSGGLGAAALASLLGRDGFGETGADARPAPTLPVRARRVIYLFQSGAPSQLDLFDYKPLLNERNGAELPAAVQGEQRLTGMTAYQASRPLAGSQFAFARHGASGRWVSELLPHTAGIVDRLCFVKSMFTEAINHDPAVTFFQTGSVISGRPSMGSWVSYGLGSMNDDLPTFVVLVSAGQGGQPLYSRLWSSGFLDARHQGVRFRSGREPVLYLANPEGVDTRSRRSLLEHVARLEQLQQERDLDPVIAARVSQYELAYRMQTSVPEVTDLSGEPDAVFEMYGEDARQPGTYARNCLLARRLAESGVRFVQLYHQGWDQHDNLPKAIREQAAEVDRPTAALIRDLEQRGLLEDTLVIWGGEFGRTAYSQGALTATNYGRDHHPRCFTVWMAGGGVRPGFEYGRTDDYGYNIADADGAILRPDKHHFTPGAVHVHDLQATILQLLGFDHTQLSYRHLGRRFRLTDVHGHVVPDLIA